MRNDVGLFVDVQPGVRESIDLIRYILDESNPAEGKATSYTKIL